MVEKVARILDPEAWDHPDEGKNFVRGITIINNRPPEVAVGQLDLTPRRTAAMAKAREIITAMREPTKAMVEAADPQGGDPGLIWHNWYRVIDAALK